MRRYSAARSRSAQASRLGGLLQAELGVPDDVGLDLVAMLLDLQLAIDDEVLAAQHHEDLVDRTEVGRDLLDDAAQLLEAPRLLRADLADLAVELEPAAEVGA